MSVSLIVISETDLDTGAVAVQVPVLDANVKTLIFQARETNTGDVFIGASDVSTAGANRGREMNPGDRGVVPVSGPGSREFWFVSAVAQKVLVQQWG